MPTYYVNSLTGSDANDGTLLTPWGSLDYALSRIVKYDVLNIASGGYSISSTISKFITLQGRGNVHILNNSSSPVFSPSSWTLTVVTCKNVIFDCNNQELFPNSSPYKVEVILLNCLILRNETQSASNVFAANTTFQGLMEDISLTRCANGSAEIDVVPGGVVAKSALIQQGRGCFLPLPENSDWDYDPALPNFFTNGWIDDVAYADGRSSISNAVIQILSGTSCRVLSPVMFFRVAPNFDSIYLGGGEDESFPSNWKKVIDSTALTSIRTIEIRSSNVLFTQSATSPAWGTHNRPVHTAITGKYVQYRLTLRDNGV